MKALAPQAPVYLVLLATLNALGALGIDMSLPANPETAQALAIDPAQMAWSLSVFLAGFAAAPLLAGPCSDRFGRRPVLLLSLAVFTLAGIGCALADSLQALLCWRLLQGLGGGAGRPVILAIVRDCFSGSEARSKLSFMAAMGMLAPLLAPSIGSLLVQLGGWRLLHGVLAVYGAIIWWLVARLYRETLASPLAQLRPASLLKGYLGVMREPRFLVGTAVTSASFGSIFAYVSASPGVFIDQLGLSPQAFGLTFAVCSLGLMAGALANGKLNARHVDPRTLLLAGAGLATLGCMGIAVCAWADVRQAWPWLVAITLLTSSGGLVSGNATQMALQPFPHHAGSASALMSAVQMAAASSAGACVGLLSGVGSALAMAMVCALYLLGVLAGVAWLLRNGQRHPGA